MRSTKISGRCAGRGQQSPQHENDNEVERRLHRWAEAKSLPLLHVQKWLALDEPGRTRLLELAEGLRMHTGQFITAFGLLEEIAVRESRPLEEVINLPSLRRTLDSPGSGPRRARLMLDELRRLRYPQLQRAGERLAEETAAIKLPPGIRIVLPRDLGSDVMRIEISAHGSLEMEQLLASLITKSSELVRLAAMLSGADEAWETE
jgi:hypothetical protein